ncbi:PAS domain S-box protein [Methylobacter tundripaludum]
MSEKNLDPSIIKPAAGSVEGITEVRRQKALLKTEALQNAILNSANFSSIATDENGVIQIFNVGAECMLGYTAADVLNKITPADISAPQEVIARAKALSAELETPIAPGFEALVFKASRGIEDIYELTYIRKDGSRFPAVVSVTALRDAQDAIIGYLLIGTDNTARKQVETERQHLLEIQEETNKQLQQTNVTLQVSEERLAVTLNSIGDAVIAIDAEARITLMNPLAEKLTGWTQVSAAGRPVNEIFHIVNKATRHPATIPVMETLAHGTIQGLANHTVLIARDGSECDIADSCAPIRDRDAQVIGAVLVFRNVTGEYAVQHTLEVQQVELELQNEELRDSQMALSILRTRYFDFYNLAPMGYCTLSEQGQILEANITAATLLGLTKDGLVKQPIFRFIFKEDADIYYRLHERLTKTDELQTGELRMVKADGTPAWVQLSISAAEDNDTPVIRIVMMDISERKRTEEALFKASALQNAIFNSANFSSIATDAKGVIQIFNVGAEHMLGYTAADVMNKITPAEISDPQEVIARAKALSVELETPITPGFEALVFKASRGIEDIYELTYIRKDGSRFPAVVSVTALRDAQDTIIGYLLIGTDNTARKQAEEALLKAGALQNAIFNSANFSSIATDAKGVIQIFNVGAERMLGYTAAEVMNKITPAEISDPQEVVARAKALSVELGTPIEPGFEALVFKASRGIEDIYELTYIRKDGSRFPAVVSITALRDAQDTIIGYLLIGTEIKAGALQSAIFNSANFSSIATDAKGVIQIFNVGAERMLGYTAAEVMNKITPAEISDPQEVIARAKALSVELGTPIEPGFEALVFKASRGIEDIYELTYIRKDGSRFPAVVSVTALRDAQDVIIGYLLIGTDNTVRKQIEEDQKKLDQRLRDQQFYTRSLIESNIDAIMTTDPSGIISDVNKQMEALTGCTRDELIGAPFKNNFTDPERAEASIKLVLSEKKVTNYELTARARDGKETVVSFNATTFYDRDRRLQGVFAAARDVTERKRLDQELERAKSVAEKANLAKSDFLSSMSHELRTPLNAILGFAQLLEAGSPPPTDAQKIRLHQIIKAGWYLLELINEILDLALIESGKLSLSREPVALIDVIIECQAMIEPQAQQRDIKLTFIPFDETWFASADRTRVKQVLINLLSNAIKYNHEHGTVEVKCIESTPERLRISVKDTGEGLAPEKLAQLFQPFNRLGQESSGKEGTGIGLVVTKQLVELMGGAIGVESIVGVGSEFWIDLLRDVTPQLAAGNAMSSEPALQTQENATPRILLYVEDNPANLMLVEQIIESHPQVRMLSARDGNLGIALARAHLPDVILMDINLPGISGIQALKILRKDPATMHIPVVAISANAMPRDIEKGLEAGFFRYLTKPIKVNEFMNALDDALKLSEIGLVNTNKTDKYDD